MSVTIEPISTATIPGPAPGIDPVAGSPSSAAPTQADPTRVLTQVDRATDTSGSSTATFGAALAAAASERSVQLSGHAVRRLEQRNIGLQDEQLDRLQKAMQTLDRRGSRQSLVMLDQVAYVVHVPSHTVVTAVAPEEGKENVFTQIDSVVIA